MKKKASFKFTPIIKCVGFKCNMACEYCFYHDLQNSNQTMSLNVLESLIKKTYQANSDSRSVSFIWHGGEPLMIGKKFYLKVLEFQKVYNRRGQETINGIQTNGTLINGDWARFFRENEFQIGISLDGPQQYHNQYRRYSNGKGSFEDIMKGIKILRENNISFGIVSVVTRTTVNYPEKVFNFFVSNDFESVKFSRALGRNDSGELLKFSPDPDRYGNFLLRILDLWIKEDNPQMEITPINEIFTSLVRGESELECLFSNQCDRFWVVNPNGDIHACISEGIGNKWEFGNITSLPIESIIESSVFKKYQEMLTRIRCLCVECKWYKVCKGGCSIDYALEFPFLGKRNVLCGSFQRLFQKAQEELIKYNLGSTF